MTSDNQNNQILFKVKRYDPETQESQWQSYPIPLRSGMTVLEGLWYIVKHIDGSLSFRYSCRGAVCGSCAMMINETITLACHTQIASLASDEIRIEPLPRMKVIKDLVCDLELFLERYRALEPYLVNDSDHDRELIQSPKARSAIFHSVKCILCTSCHAACPLTGVDKDYLGPALLTAAQRFAFDDRNDNKDKMLARAEKSDGSQSCWTISRCTETCPKEIGPSHRITEIKRAVRKKYASED